MRVIEYLKENGTEKLTSELGVIVKKYEDAQLFVLNYDQINSPKNDITSECRGLILDYDYNIVSRSFDRFFNYGEQFATFNPLTAVAYEKVDGSLIKIYEHKGHWYCSTRGTAFAESGVNGWDLTFKDMVCKALSLRDEEDFQAHCNTLLDESRTYIFEVTGLQNRVVTRYEDESLWFLASRNNKTGKYYTNEFVGIAQLFKAKLPRQFKFDSIEHCLETAKHLPDLQEGYVMYSNGIPVCKVKSPIYTAIHHLRGEGLNPKRIAELVVINEQDEYLTYFPEDEKHFILYTVKLLQTLIQAQDVLIECFGIQDQKEFALKVKDYPFAQFLFQARKLGESNVMRVFNASETNRKVKFLLGLMGEKDE
jgi:T4 RnlA family RNA ligase